MLKLFLPLLLGKKKPAGAAKDAKGGVPRTPAEKEAVKAD